MWRLVINNLLGRPIRSLLLATVVALSAALITAAGAGMATAEASLRQSIGQAAGLADLRIQPATGKSLSPALWQQVRDMSGVAIVSPRRSLSVRATKEGQQFQPLAEMRGVVPAEHEQLFPLRIIAGRRLQSQGEVVIDTLIAEYLSAAAGDVITFRTEQFPPTTTQLRVVGVYKRISLGILQSPIVYATLDDVHAAAGDAPVFSQIDIGLTEAARGEISNTHNANLNKAEGDTSSPLDAIEAALQTLAPPDARIDHPGAAAGGLNRAIDAGRIGLSLLTAVIFLGAALIMLTGMTTAVTQRMRELALLRCVGASRTQMAISQLIAGVLLSLLGGAAGLPLGLLAGRMVYEHYRDTLTAGFVWDPQAAILAMIGAAVTGVVGSLLPAIVAAKARPMAAMSVRAKSLPRWIMTACLVVGCVCVITPMTASWWITSNDRLILFLLIAGVPMLVAGYFLLAPPLMTAAVRWLTPALSFALRTPRTVLEQTLAASPFRRAFTGAALSIGLAALVSVWSIGRSVTVGWFDQLQMPDAFVSSFRSLTPEQVRDIENLRVVESISATTAFPVLTRNITFGPTRLAPPTLFVSSDIDSFFAMTRLIWVEGNERDAQARLQQGGAVLVSEEFRTAHQLGVGDEVIVAGTAEDVPFEIAGVIASPGLDIAVNYFGIEQAYTDASLGSMFGTRADGLRVFGIDDVNLLLIKLRDDVSDDIAMHAIRRHLPAFGAVAGSSRIIIHTMRESTAKVMAVASVVAICCLIIAAIGVGHLVVAELHARQFEMGVLRAAGATPAVLAKLIIAETLLLACVGCITGTGLGVQFAALDHAMHERLLGVSYPLHLHLPVIVGGCAAVVALSLLAAAAPIRQLMTTPITEMLAARG